MLPLLIKVLNILCDECIRSIQLRNIFEYILTNVVHETSAVIRVSPSSIKNHTSAVSVNIHEMSVNFIGADTTDNGVRNFGISVLKSLDYLIRNT